MSGKENDCKNDQQDNFVHCRWKETCPLPNPEPNQSTHPITLQFIPGKYSDCQLLLCLFSKILFLDGAVGKGLQSAYTTHCNAADIRHINPHERFLVGMTQLSCVPTQHYTTSRRFCSPHGIEEKFNSLLRERLDAANN